MDELLAGLSLPARPEILPAWTMDAHTHLDTTTEYTGLATDDARFGTSIWREADIRSPGFHLMNMGSLISRIIDILPFPMSGLS